MLNVSGIAVAVGEILEELCLGSINAEVTKKKEGHKNLESE